MTTRIPPDRLYSFVSWYAPKLLPAMKRATLLFGPAGRRLVPIIDYSHTTLSAELQRKSTILDTYDALGAVYDKPQGAATLRRWFDDGGLIDVEIRPNLVDAPALVGRGRAPHG